MVFRLPDLVSTERGIKRNWKDTGTKLYVLILYIQHIKAFSLATDKSRAIFPIMCVEVNANLLDCPIILETMLHMLFMSVS